MKAYIGPRWVLGGYPAIQEPGAPVEVSIQVDPQDTLHAYWTMATLILPIMKQLQHTQTGSTTRVMVSDSDVPEDLRGLDSEVVKEKPAICPKWAWMTSTIVAAFEKIVVGDYGLEDIDEVQLGLTLFAKYFRFFEDAYSPTRLSKSATESRYHEEKSGSTGDPESDLITIYGDSARLLFGAESVNG